MSIQQAKYELLKEQVDISRNNYTCLRVCVLISLCAASAIAVYATWTVIYKQSLNFPPKLADIPQSWIHRAELYNSYKIYKHDTHTYDLNTNITDNSSYQQTIKQIENERIYPSRLGNFIYEETLQEQNKKLVCYYSAPVSRNNKYNNLYPNNIDPHLCTHINVGIVPVINNRLVLNEQLESLFIQTKELKLQNRNLKILIWTGGANAGGFSQMVTNHANRKIFIQSLKSVLETYRLDGIDLDWEFPSAYNRERQHFSQLLHEIRREYQREHRTYLLSVAVAAPEGIVYFAYDIREINYYADYINVMTYDYHFFMKGAPFTGLNAPLYARHNERSILGTLNLNYTSYYWHTHGMDKSKIVIGLPTYGHSFRLVNPFNNGIGSPAEDIGNVGTLGFVPYSELCWFRQNNIYVTNVFDIETCSPYLYSGLEWISYENEKSLECKTQYIKKNGFGGAMIFSLNTDDYGSYCEEKTSNSKNSNSTGSFPLVRKIYSTLFS